MYRPFQEILEDITKKEVKALTEGDIKFLRSRKSYLSEEELERYDSVINPKPKTTNKSKK